MSLEYPPAADCPDAGPRKVPPGAVRRFFQASADLGRPENRLDLTIPLLLVLPFLILLFNIKWLFNFWNYCDPWIYLGYFLDYPRHVRISDEGYFGTRLSAILPGYLVYRLFQPMVANYVLHLLLYETSLLSFYLILKNVFARRVAALASVMLGCYPFFLWAVGWDYVDSFGICYFLLSALMLTLAGKSGGKARHLLLAGVFAAALVFANLSFIIYLPALVGFYYFGSAQGGRRRLLRGLAWFALGSIGLMLVLGLAHHTAGGRFWFFVPSIKWALFLLSRPNPYQKPIWIWLAGASWLIVPLLATVAALVLVCRGRRGLPAEYRRPAILFQVNLVVVLFALIAATLKGTPLLQYPFECSLVIPLAFLAFAAPIHFLVLHLSTRQFVVCLTMAVLVLLIPFVLSPLTPLFISSLPSWATIPLFETAPSSTQVSESFAIPAPAMTIPLCTGGAALLLLLIPRPKLCTVMAFFLLLSVTNFFAARVGFYGPIIKDLTWKPRAANPDTFRSVVQCLKAVQDVDPSGKIYYWFEPSERHSGLFLGVGLAGLWLRNLDYTGYPGSRVGSPFQFFKPRPQDRLVFLSDQKDIPALVQAAVAPAGLRAEILREKPIREQTVQFTLTFFELVQN